MSYLEPKLGCDVAWPIRDFLYQPYAVIHQEMQHWAESGAPSQIWLGEHPLVVSQGVRARGIALNLPYPVQRSSRGGLLSLHLPGQLIFYPLYRYKDNFDVPRYVALLESVVMQYLDSVGVHSYRCRGFPGVYTSQGKIASLGLRTRCGGAIHGLSFNVCCPLYPFTLIESCGQKEMPITNLAAHGIFPMLVTVKKTFAQIFLQLLAQEFG